MINIMPYVLGYAFIASLLGIGFIIGQIYERIQRNKLIRSGVIPRPRTCGGLNVLPKSVNGD